MTSPLEGSDGAIAEARRLAKENPDWVYLNQYGNDANWQAHFNTTGPEIVAQAPGPVTHFVATVGTGGTFTGVGRYLKAQNPNVQLVELQLLVEVLVVEVVVVEIVDRLDLLQFRIANHQAVLANVEHPLLSLQI